jgi:hypothetical protein
MLFAPYEGEENLPPNAPEIGIPQILNFHEMLRSWVIVLSFPTSRTKS